MKKSDLAMIVFIASVSVLIAFLIAKAIFGDVYNGTAKVKIIEKYTSQVVQPDEDIFNENAINPTIQITITGTK